MRLIGLFYNITSCCKLTPAKPVLHKNATFLLFLYPSPFSPTPTLLLSLIPYLRVYKSESGKLLHSSRPQWQLSTIPGIPFKSIDYNRFF